MLACKETTSITKQLIIKFPRPILAKELVALAINMSLNERCAAMFTEQRGLRHLMDRAIDTKDPSVSVPVQCAVIDIPLQTEQ